MLIVLLALILRVIGIGFGLPHTYQLDESSLVRQAFGFFKWDGEHWDFNPHNFSSPSLASYIYFAEYALLYGVGKLSGAFSGAADFIARYVCEPSLFYLLPRYSMAFCGSLVVLLLYRLAGALAGGRVAVLASLLLALAPTAVEHGHYLRAYPLASVFSLTSMLFILKVLRGGGVRDYLLAGLFIGLSVSTEYSPLLLLVSFGLAALLSVRGRSDVRRQLVRYCYGVLAAMAVFALSSPYFLLDFRVAWQDFCLEDGCLLGGSHFGLLSAVALIEKFDYYFLARGLGYYSPAAVLLMGYGFYWSLRLRPRENIVLASFPGLLVLLMLNGSRVEEKFILLALPFMVYYLALGLVLTGKRVRKLGWARVLVGMLVAALLLLGVLRTTVVLRRFLAVDSREIALAWLEKRAAAGRIIFCDAYGPRLRTYDDLATALLTYRYRGARDEVVDCYLRQPVYDGYRVPFRPHHAAQTSHFYESALYRDFDYFVISSYIYEAVQSRPKKYPRENEFYRGLEKECELVKEIGGVTSRYSGPVIKIYRQRALGGSSAVRAGSTAMAVRRELSLPRLTLGYHYYKREMLEAALIQMRRAVQLDPGETTERNLETVERAIWQRQKEVKSKN